jgi:hypothetical protein
MNRRAFANNEFPFTLQMHLYALTNRALEFKEGPGPNGRELDYRQKSDREGNA